MLFVSKYPAHVLAHLCHSMAIRKSRVFPLNYMRIWNMFLLLVVLLSQAIQL